MLAVRDEFINILVDLSQLEVTNSQNFGNCVFTLIAAEGLPFHSIMDRFILGSSVVAMDTSACSLPLRH